LKVKNIWVKSVYCIPGYTGTNDPGSKLDQTYAGQIGTKNYIQKN